MLTICSPLLSLPHCCHIAANRLFLLAVTPPGFYTTISGSTGTTDKCGDGYYRAEWKPAVAASTCSACGPDIYSNTDDQITVYAITPDAAESAEDVRTSASACCE